MYVLSDNLWADIYDELSTEPSNEIFREIHDIYTI